MTTSTELETHRAANRDGNRAKIVVVGSTMMDLISYSDRIPAAGQTLSGSSFGLGFGGKGANQAVMARLLGADVTFIGRVGDDSFGESTLRNFEQFGIDTTALPQTQGAPTGTASIWVTPDGTNRIICVGGANDALTYDEAADAVRRVTDMSVVVAQFEVPESAVEGAFRAANRAGATTVLNPAPSRPISDALLEVTDWLIVNENEFDDLSQSRGMAGPHIDDDRAITNLARAVGVKIVITLGADGAALCLPDGDVSRISAPAVDVADTTGAGDAFVGAFAFGLASGWPEVACVAAGCSIAAQSVTRRGTQSSYPRGVELSALLRSAGAIRT